LNCEILEFPEMKHGWVLRGDADDQKIRDAAKLAMATCAKFLSEN